MTPLRFDLGAKIIYAKHRLEGRNTKWYIDLYKDHILVFNGGWEYPGTKTSLDDFIRAFNDLIDNFSVDKAGIIPIGTNGVIREGAHRMAISLVTQKTLKFKQLNQNCTIYDYNFFTKRLKHGIATGTPGLNKTQIKSCMNRVYSDEIALEFCRWCPFLKIITMFPKAAGNDSRATKLIRQRGSIVYSLSLKTSKDGLNNLIKELYRGESWIGGFYTSGSANKTHACWDANNPYIRFYLYLPRSDHTCQELKKEIRGVYGIGNHSVHINDTQEETIRIGSSIFNKNSRHFLQNSAGTLCSSSKKTLSAYRQKTSQDCCITGSLPLELYGLRVSRDLDYIHSKDSLEKLPLIDSHNKYEELFGTTLDDIIYNPAHHFYFAGIKVICLEALRKMKSNRGELKDQKDIQLIDSCSKPVESRLI